MKKLNLVVLMLLLTVGLAVAKDYEVNKKAGPFDVQVRIDRNPPVVGSNNMEVVVKEAGKTVTDAKVRVDYSMPAMPGMPPMNYKTNADLQGDRFAATMNLSMSGPWNIAVKIKKDGKTSTVKFNIDAH